MVLSSSKEKIKGPKRIERKTTVWKYNEYAMPICRPEKPCWNIAHKRLFDR